jgi:glycosyltransferase involved in cell wall biosynthesis
MDGGLSATLRPRMTIAVSEELPRLRSLSFVFPMFNECGNIERCVTEAIAAGRRLACDFEIIIVDDASTDGSGVLADKLAIQYPQLRVIHHSRNRKFGGAVKTGFAAARNDWILYTDSDLPIRLSDAALALPLTRDADMIIGYRLRRTDGLKRQLMSFAYNRLIQLMFDINVRDVNFAFKLFRRSILDNFRLRSAGGFIDAELLIEAREVGARIREIGLEYQPRIAGKSTLASFGAVTTVVHNLAVYRRRRQKRRAVSIR